MKHFKNIILAFFMLFVLFSSSMATVSSEDTPRVQYTANGITTNFPITFTYVSISDVQVYFISNSTGLATAWTKDASGPTGYTVSAGAIVANTAPSNGYLVAVCTTPVTQLVDVKPNRALTADTLEGVFDKLTLIGRDLKGSVSRALIYGPTYTGSIPYAEDLADEIKQDSVDASVAAVNALTFATSLHIDNIAALRLFPGGETTSIYLDCHTTNGDGGHGTFRWAASSTAADDNGVTIAVTGVATGRWIRQLNGFVAPEMFGGGESGLASALTYGGVCIADGDYVLTADIIITHTNVKLRGTGSVSGAGSLTFRGTMADIMIDGLTFENNTSTVVVVGTKDTDTGLKINSFTAKNCKVSSCTSGFDIVANYNSAVFENNLITNINNPGGAFAIRAGQFITLGTEDMEVFRATKNYISGVQSTTGSCYGIQTIRSRHSDIGQNFIKDVYNTDNDDCEGIYTKSLNSLVRGNFLWNAGCSESQIAIKGSGFTEEQTALVEGNFVYQDVDRLLAQGITVQVSRTVVRNNYIENAYKRGIWVGGASSPGDVVIEDNQVFNTIGSGIVTTPATAGNTAAIYLTGTGKKHVRRNKVIGVSNTADVGYVNCIFSVDNAELYLDDNELFVDDLSLGTPVHIQIASSPTKVRIRRTDFGTVSAENALYCSTTGGVTDLILDECTFDGTFTSKLVFSGGVAPTSYRARNNAGLWEASATVDLPSIAAGGKYDYDFTIADLGSGGSVSVNTPSNLQSMIVFANVRTSTTVRMTVFNPNASSIDIGAARFAVIVNKF